MVGFRYIVSPCSDGLPNMTCALGFLKSIMILNRVATELSCVLALQIAVGRLSWSASKARIVSVVKSPWASSFARNKLVDAF